VASCGCPKDFVERWVSIAATENALDHFNAPIDRPAKTCLMVASAAGDAIVVKTLLKYRASTRGRNVLMTIWFFYSGFGSTFLHFSMPNYPQASATYSTVQHVHYHTVRTCVQYSTLFSLLVPPHL